MMRLSGEFMDVPARQIGFGFAIAVISGVLALAATAGAATAIGSTDRAAVPPAITCVPAISTFGEPLDWEGTQPGSVTATVEVMGEIISERRDVYLSNCG